MVIERDVKSIQTMIEHREIAELTDSSRGKGFGGHAGTRRTRNRDALEFRQ